MKKFGRFVGNTAKWIGILAAVYLGSLFLSGLDFETRIGWFLAGLAMSIAYVDGSLKDRISMLEYRVDELNRRLNEHQ